MIPKSCSTPTQRVAALPLPVLCCQGPTLRDWMMENKARVPEPLAADLTTQMWRGGSNGCGKWPIEIDGLPIKNGDFFHGELLNNQRVLDT